MKKKKTLSFFCRNNTLFYLCLILFLPFPAEFFLTAQERSQDETGLNLKDKGLKIENSIDLFITQSKYEAVKAITGLKIPVPAKRLIINGDTLHPNDISTRGQTTLNFRRKSYGFSLSSKASFRHGARKGSLRKFLALSLSMDMCYANNRLAFEMMEKAHLFDLFYTFSALHINGNDEGIYMIVERPEDWAMKKKNSPFLIRRGYENLINKEVADKRTLKEGVRKYDHSFKQIYRYLNRFEGRELLDSVSKYLDIRTYMKWLAFNYFVRNGDYTDEVWFYFDPETKKFSIIPWDYDDLFFAGPHEGEEASREYTLGKIIFSAEDILDRKIATDPYIYKIYLKYFSELLEQVSDEVIIKAFENTYAELCPYYSCAEIIKMSENDAYGISDQAKLRSGLYNRFLVLITTRKRCLEYIKNNH